MGLNHRLQVALGRAEPESHLGIPLGIMLSVPTGCLQLLSRLMCRAFPSNL